jgi:hypothetical protein
MRGMAMLILAAASVVTSGCFPVNSTHRLNIKAGQIRILDTTTKKPVREVLVIPQYVRVETSTTPFSMRDDNDIYQDYVADPFLFREGDVFRPVESKSRGVVWMPGCAFTGKQVLMKGALILAAGYQPRWLSTSDIEQTKGSLFLNPISEETSSVAMEGILKQIARGTLRMPEECTRYYLSPCVLEVRFRKNEQKLVRLYLQEAVK